MVKVDQHKKSEKAILGVLAKSGVRQLIFMTDAVDMAGTLNTVSGLPGNSVVIYRGYNDPNRAYVAALLCRAVQSAGQRFLVAGDVRLARGIGADGLHMPEYMLHRTRPNLFGFGLVTAACHSRSALRRASDLGVDAALVSPVFATNSHPGVRPLGLHRFARLVSGARVPVVALGGINPLTAGHLRALNLHAVAGMSSIV